MECVTCHTELEWEKYANACARFVANSMLTIDLSRARNSTSVRKNTRARFGWTFSYIYCNFFSTLTSTRCHCLLECGKGLLIINCKYCGVRQPRMRDPGNEVKGLRNKGKVGERNLCVVYSIGGRRTKKKKRRKRKTN